MFENALTTSQGSTALTPARPIRAADGLLAAPEADAAPGQVTATLEALAAQQAECERRVVAALARAHRDGTTIDTSGLPTEAGCARTRR